MKISPLLSLALGCLMLGATQLARAAEQPACITFVLDCSAEMSALVKNDFRAPHAAEPPSDAPPARTAEPEVTGARRVIRSSAIDELPAGQEISKLDAARHVLAATLDKLSAEGNHRVSLWLFGHRLAWEQKSDPGLMEQTTYLEQTLGFDVLRDLLPGDDVEMIRPMLRLEPRDLAAIGLRLSAVKPWGECPLYLGMERAIDAHDRHSQADRRVIVISCGVNHQGLAKSTSNKSSVLDTLDSTPVPVHIIRFGVEGDRQQESELGQIARTSHGSYHRANSAAELASLVEAALSDEPTGSFAGTNSTANSTVIAPVGTSGATVKMSQPVLPPPAVLKGKVTYYKSIVRNAKVLLDLGKTKREAKTDATGEFVFENVPPGAVVIHVEAVVQNKIRTKTMELSVDPTAEKPTAILIDLE